MLTTTLEKIREHEPCPDGWAKLLDNLGKTKADDEPLTLESILESNGLNDALWALKAIDGHQNAIRLYGCYCARYSLNIFERAYSDDKRPRQAIEVAERVAHGWASKEELDAAGDAARDAAGDAAWAARAAAWAARAAARDAFKRELLRLCRLDGEYGEVQP